MHKVQFTPNHSRAWVRLVRLSPVAVLLAAAGVSALAVGAGKLLQPRSAPRRLMAGIAIPQATPTPVTNGAPARARNLSLRPEAFELSRRLGQRFHSPGREVSVQAGTLTIGSSLHTVMIRRSQTAGGERVEVALDGSPASLVWDAEQGARSSGVAAAGEERLIAERLALDSPDQFVQAQLRGASYRTVTRGFRLDAGGADGYAGPVFDVVQVSERSGEAAGPASTWRLYYINNRTGLPDRVVSREQGATVEAEFGAWANVAGELSPARVTWRRQGQVVMELVVTGVTYGPAQ